MALLTRADTGKLQRRPQTAAEQQSTLETSEESRISEAWLNYFASFIYKIIKFTGYTTPIFFKHGVNSSDKCVNSDCLPICELCVPHELC